MSNGRQQKRQILTRSSLTHLGEQLAHTGKGLSMKLPYTKSRCWQSLLSGFPFLHMCSLLCYRWPVKSHHPNQSQHHPRLMGYSELMFPFPHGVINFIEDTLQRECLWGWIRIPCGTTDRQKGEWVLRRFSSSPFTCHWVIPSYSVSPEVLHKWYGWPF